ncbi:DUF4974 domain-containing protein [Fulvivirga sp. M361]|uniref:FecR family protein n=1 Tax=Fulvivirga sp. M361 TaxID=2594266 RepID=UPI00117B7FD7|nr:FecR domain-containing protein [Fulvivirga sp. M361]TRX57560.1 DUF4974 domain-containing protein [Fulvivirga sp. M361]
MTDSDSLIKLITKEFSGEISDNEKQRLENELSGSSDKQRIFNYLKVRWEAAGRLKPSVTVAIPWDDVRERIIRQVQQPAPPSRMKQVFLKSRWYYVAATIFFLVAMVFLLTREFKTNMVKHQALYEPVTVLLPDSSTVWLNTGATLHYREDYNEERRAIKLVGEGFFDVIANENKPFIITTNETQITVLGTSFNAKDQVGDAFAEVTVVTGKVAFYAADNQRSGEILTPGYKGIYDKNTGLFTKTRNTNLNFLSWKDHKLIFKAASLTEVITVLENYFKKEIKSRNDRLLSCQFTMEFDSPSMEEVLEVLAISAGIEYELVNETYYLTGPGCD